MHFSFCKFEGREHSTRVRGRRVRAARIAGWRRSIQERHWKLLSFPFSSCDRSELGKLQVCHGMPPLWATPSSTQISPQLGPGLHLKDGSSHRPHDLSFCPHSSFPSRNSVHLSLSSTPMLASLLFLLFFLSSLPCSFNLPQKRKPLQRGEGSP